MSEFRIWVKDELPEQPYLIALLLRICNDQRESAPIEFVDYVQGRSSLELTYAVSRNHARGGCDVTFFLRPKESKIPRTWKERTDWIEDLQRIAATQNKNGDACSYYEEGVCLARVIAQQDASVGPEPCSNPVPDHRQCAVWQMFPDQPGVAPRFSFFGGPESEATETARDQVDETSTVETQIVNPPNTWSELQNHEYGFAFHYPNGWQEVDGHSSLILRPPTARSFIASDTGETRRIYSPAVTLMMSGRGNTAGEPSRAAIESVFAALPNFFADYKAIADEWFVLDSRQRALEVVYELTVGGRPFVAILVLAVTNEHLFMFDGSCLKCDIGDHESTLRSVVRSLRIETESGEGEHVRELVSPADASLDDGRIQSAAADIEPAWKSDGLSLRCQCNSVVRPKRKWLGMANDVSCSQCQYRFMVVRDLPSTASDCACVAEQRYKEAEFADTSKKERGLRQSISIASHGLFIHPQAVECLYVRAFAFQALKEHERAITEWTSCLRNGFRRAICVFKRALALTEFGRHDEAVRDYSRLVDGDLVAEREEQGVNRFDVYMNRGMTLCELNRFEEAAQDFALVEPYSSPGGRLSYWQLVCEFRGDKDKAMNAYLKR